MMIKRLMIALMFASVLFTGIEFLPAMADGEDPPPADDPGQLCYDYGTDVDPDTGNAFMQTDDTQIVCDIPETTQTNEASTDVNTEDGVPNDADPTGVTEGSYD